jgi:hypothetical protein
MIDCFQNTSSGVVPQCSRLELVRVTGGSTSSVTGECESDVQGVGSIFWIAEWRVFNGNPNITTTTSTTNNNHFEARGGGRDPLVILAFPMLREEVRDKLDGAGERDRGDGGVEDKTARCYEDSGEWALHEHFQAFDASLCPLEACVWTGRTGGGGGSHGGAGDSGRKKKRNSCALSSSGLGAAGCGARLPVVLRLLQLTCFTVHTYRY